MLCKGLDDDQVDEVFNQIKEELQLLSDIRRENSDYSGILYDAHEKIRDILTEYNDTLRGRCAICLEDFKDEDHKALEKFSDRQDLVRVDACFHKYHLKCLYRDWFMQRKIEKDEFGCEIIYKIPKDKKCPTCRRVVNHSEIDYIKIQYSKHPEVNDHAY